MKFSINRAAFIKELNNVSRAISSKTTIPILTGLKIVASDAGLLLTGSNADISIETLIRADDPDIGLAIDEPGSIVLTARFFSEIVKRLPEKDMTSAGLMAALSNMYEKPSAANKVHLMRRLFNLKMAEGASVAQHLNELNTVTT